MQDWRAQYLGLTTFPATLTGAELDELFTLGDEIARTVGARRTPLTRLGLVLQIGFLRLTGRSLNSVQVIPPAVLARAGQAADISVPQLALIRSIYRRRMTLYQHQQAAMAAMGFKDYGDATERALTGHLRRIATQSFDNAALTRQAMTWLFAHHWVLPGQSRIEDRVAAAQAYVTKAIRAEMIQAVGGQCVQHWIQNLSAIHDMETGETLFEWLRRPASGSSQSDIAEGAHRLDVLRQVTALDAAITAGDIGLRKDRLRIPKLEALGEGPDVRATRKALFGAIGAVQLPDILIEIDALTHFSWILLGRQPASTTELTLVYCALPGLGTMQSAASVSRMVAGVTDDQIEHVMRQIIASRQLRAASDAVVNYMLSHPVARRWGTGKQASADMMSLDATRHLWNARTEPRRGTRAIGTYSHILDQWPIIYDQAIVLNQRQAGVAIEGVLQQQIAELQRLAVDTPALPILQWDLPKFWALTYAPASPDFPGASSTWRVVLSCPPGWSRLSSVYRSAARHAADGMVSSISRRRSRADMVRLQPSSSAMAARREEIGSTNAALWSARSCAACSCWTILLTQNFAARFIGCLPRVNRSMPCNAHCWPDASRQSMAEPRMMRTPSAGPSLLTNVVLAWNTAAMQTEIEANPALYPTEHLTHIARCAPSHQLEGSHALRHRTAPSIGSQQPRESPKSFQSCKFNNLEISTGPKWLFSAIPTTATFAENVTGTPEILATESDVGLDALGEQAGGIVAAQ